MNNVLPSNISLRDYVRNCLKQYFKSLEGATPTGIYDLVLTEMEIPLLEMVMEFTEGNQSKAADCLGLNRVTLKKLLNKYQLK